MEYKEALLMNYANIVNFDTETHIEEHDSGSDTYISFPCKTAFTQKGKQFYILGVLKWILHVSGDIKSEVYFLIYEPTGKDMWQNFYYYDNDLDTGNLFVATLTKGKQVKHTPSMFFDGAMKYKKEHNITPLFLSLMSHDQISEIKKDLRDEFFSHL